MKIVLQVVSKASVEIDKKVIAQIDKGYLLLVSFTEGDTFELCDKMINKILKLRVFLDENGKTNLSLADVNGAILSVSQFTLYASLNKGNRPSYVNCMHPDEATKLYDYFNKKLKETSYFIQTGEFGADMKVSLINDGPYTLVLDSKELF